MRTHSGLILPTPALHLRDPGPLVAGFRTNWNNVNQAHGKTLFRIRAFHPDLPYVKRVLDPLCKVWIDDPEDAFEFWQRLCTNNAPSWFPALEDNPSTLYAVDTVTFLTTTGINTYTKPVDWNNAANHIEGIGEGSVGANSGIITTGGGGGAYCRANNQTILSSNSYRIGVGNSNTSSYFFSSTYLMAAASASQTASTGGTSLGYGSVNNNGGTGSGAVSLTGGGGGGSAGPTGVGTSPSTTDGGSGDAGSGGAGGITPGAAGAGNPGANGTEWDASHGAGGGGSGANGSDTAQHTGGTAGNYGAGAGGDAYGAASASLAAQGIIVVTYTPLGGSYRMFSMF